MTRKASTAAISATMPPMSQRLTDDDPGSLAVGRDASVLVEADSDAVGDTEGLVTAVGLLVVGKVSLGEGDCCSGALTVKVVVPEMGWESVLTTRKVIR